MPDSSSPSFSNGRKFNTGLNAFISVIAMLGVALMVNYLAERHFRRFTLTSDNRNQLSPTTLLVLKSLTNQVNVTVLFNPEDDLYSAVSTQLKEYGLASPKLRLEYVDYRLQPEKALRVKTEYHLPDDAKDLIIFNCNSKTKYVNQSELSEYDFSKLMSGTSNEIKRKAFHGERLFTSAILTVSDPTPAKAYFLFSHGESDPRGGTNDRDFGRFATLLSESSIQWGGIALNGTNEIPADCQMLIVAGALTKLDAGEQEKIDRYLNQGGRMLLLFSRTTSAGLEGLMGRWGVEVGDDLVHDPDNSDPGRSLLVMNFASHPVVKPLMQAQLPMVLVPPRSIRKKAGSTQSADAAQVTELATTSAKGVAVQDWRKGIRPNLASDRQGAIPVMAAVEKGSLKGVNLDRGSTRIVVVGDADFLNNQMLNNNGNREFAWHAVNWLLDRSQLLGGIGPRDFKVYKINIPPTSMQRLRWILLGGVPGAILAFGFMVWLRRRH